MKIELTDKFYFPETERSYTTEGYLIVPATISRPGTQVYRASELVPSLDKLPGHIKPTDNITVYRPPEEVFKPESVNSFKNIAVTNNHPPEFLNSKNHKTYSIGIVLSDVLADEKHVQGTIKVTDYDAVNEIKAGKVDISAGYHSNVTFEEGVTPDGENYQAIQRDIIGNHVAVVMRGRAGSEVCLADGLDDPSKESENRAAEGKEIQHGTEASETREENKKKPKGEEEELGADNVPGSNASNPFGDEKEVVTGEVPVDKKKVKTMDEMKQELQDAFTKIDELTKSNSDLSSKIVDQDGIDKLVCDRMDLIDVCTQVSPELVHKGKSNYDLKKEVLTSKMPSISLEDKSQDYIDAAFDVIKSTLKDSSSMEEEENKDLSLEDEGEPTKPESPADEAKAIEATKNTHEGENPDDSASDPEKDDEDSSDNTVVVKDSISVLDSAFELEIKNKTYSKTDSPYEEYCKRSRDAWKKK